MNNDFVYNQVLSGALKAGASQSSSRNAAVKALEDYKKGKFDKAIKLIETAISGAVKASKLEGSFKSKSAKKR